MTKKTIEQQCKSAVNEAICVAHMRAEAECKFKQSSALTQAGEHCAHVCDFRQRDFEWLCNWAMQCTEKLRALNLSAI